MMRKIPNAKAPNPQKALEFRNPAHLKRWRTIISAFEIFLGFGFWLLGSFPKGIL